MFPGILRMSLVLGAVSLLAGCSRGYEYPEAEKIDASAEVAKIVKLLETTNPMAHKMAVARLGELGPVASSAVPDLQKFGRKHPEFKKEVDESIAKIQASAPPK